MNSYSYTAYQALFEDLVKKGTSTGESPSEDIVKYTKLNWSRAKRNDKTFKAIPETIAFLKSLNNKYKIKIITEPWCGDAAQVVPAVAGIAKESDKITVEVVLRDENEDLMDRYLTNGGKAIPIAIIIDDTTGEELGHWGPRPTEAQKMVLTYKSTPETERASYDDFVQIVQKWYNTDKTESIQNEFIQKFNELIK